MAKKKHHHKKHHDGERRPGGRSGVYGLGYGISAYGWFGGPYWGPGGVGQVGTGQQAPLSPDQFGSVEGGGDGGGGGSL